MVESIVSALLTEAVQRTYHVTFLAYLPPILRKGLVVNSGNQSNYGPMYSGHVFGRLFFTEFEGIGGWMHRLWYQGFNSSDTPIQDNLIPVALRVSLFAPTYTDEPGTNDSRSSATFSTATKRKPVVIQPKLIQVWDGEGWKQLSTTTITAMKQRVLDHTTIGMEGEELLTDKDGPMGYLEREEEFFAPEYEG
jgi:hypothetical protein